MPTEAEETGALTYSNVSTGILDPSTIPEDRSLVRMLTLMDNQISEVSPEINSFTNLIILRIIDNPLIINFPNIFSLKTIVLLYMVRCGLTAVPDEIGNLTGLKLINFSQNKIKSISPALFMLPSLKYAILDNNSIEKMTIPGDADVSELNLSLLGNPLKEEDESLEILGRNGLSELFGLNVKFTVDDSNKEGSAYNNSRKQKRGLHRLTVLGFLSILFLIVLIVGWIFIFKWLFDKRTA